MSIGVVSYADVGPSSLADPSGSSAILTATQWISNTLLGPLATSVAVIAIGWMGLMMLSGRIDLRRGLAVVSGCFILFGAPTIAKGLMHGIGDGGNIESRNYAASAASTVAPQLVPPPSTPNAYDPYAGASLKQ